VGNHSLSEIHMYLYTEKFPSNIVARVKSW